MISEMRPADDQQSRRIQDAATQQLREDERKRGEQHSRQARRHAPNRDRPNTFPCSFSSARMSSLMVGIAT